MCENVNGLVVHVEETIDAAPKRQHWSVTGEYIRIELQMLRHILPV